MVQAAGGWSLSAYCVPQVVQMKFGMMVSRRDQLDTSVLSRSAMIRSSGRYSNW
jgi:hypothetical protein